ncbi:MAG: iron ABC transporter substrate-binding protein [Thermoleophilaceae bacterium]|nr:iron ABC transporter substrate-binding protein [Thermoleophilaceae bacterium]
MKIFTRRSSSLLIVLAALATSLAALSGCGSSSNTASSENKLVIYSGREVELVEPLYKKFEQDTGIKLEVRNAESPELAATLQEEGKNSPADVFYAQDAGSIGSVENLLAPLPTASANLVAKRFLDSGGRWTGITGRVRTLIYNTDKLKESDLPDSVYALTDPKWKGRLGIAPGNASFQAFVTAMRLTEGEAKTKTWLEGMKANDVKTFEKNSQIAEAVSRDEIDAGLVNHYYLYEIKAENPKAPAANHFFTGTDPGTLVNASAAGILATAKHRKQAEQFLAYLLNEGQKFFANEAEEREYPLVESSGAVAPEGLPPLDSIKGPDVNLSEFGKELPATAKLIDSIGFQGA